MMASTLKRMSIKNRWSRNGLISLFVANILILIGKDSWAQRFTDPMHYLDMLVTFISVLIILELIDRINQALNERYEWKRDTFKRVVSQLVLAITIPIVLAVIITFIQWEFLWHKSLITGQYFKYEFLPQVLLILIINLLFVAVSLFGKLTTGEATVSSPTIIGRKGSQKIPVATSQIASIHLNNGLAYLTTFDGNEYMLAENLDHYEKTLSDDTFFRANRQYIMNRAACKSFASGANGKVDVVIFPASAHIQVSQKRATHFRSWISS